MNYLKVNDVKGGPSLQAWAVRFVKDQAGEKSLVLTRAVSNWQTHLIDGWLRSLVASLRYQGTVTIAFPLLFSRVVVETKTTGFIGRLMALVKEKNVHEAATTVWPYAERGEAAEGQPRGWAVQSETQWWKEWKPAVARAIVDGRRGWVSSEDVMEEMMIGGGELKVRTNWAQGI